MRTTALTLFVAHGHHAESLRQIAIATPFAQGSVVHRFGRKAGPLRAIEDAIFDRLQIALDDLLPNIDTANELRRTRDANLERPLEANPEIGDLRDRTVVATSAS